MPKPRDRYPVENPPKGVQKRNSFWVDHYHRLEAQCECDLPAGSESKIRGPLRDSDSRWTRPYDCLMWDAEFYAGETEDSMPGAGTLIRAARRIYAKLSAPDSDRTLR
jgi:hypothetical protein